MKKYAALVPAVPGVILAGVVIYAVATAGTPTPISVVAWATVAFAALAVPYVVAWIAGGIHDGGKMAINSLIAGALANLVIAGLQGGPGIFAPVAYGLIGVSIYVYERAEIAADLDPTEVR